MYFVLAIQENLVSRAGERRKARGRRRIPRWRKMDKQSPLEKKKKNDGNFRRSRRWEKSRLFICAVFARPPRASGDSTPTFWYTLRIFFLFLVALSPTSAILILSRTFSRVAALAREPLRSSHVGVLLDGHRKRGRGKTGRKKTGRRENERVGIPSVRWCGSRGGVGVYLFI